jgi:hypothetical protein
MTFFVMNILPSFCLNWIAKHGMKDGMELDMHVLSLRTFLLRDDRQKLEGQKDGWLCPP